MQDILEQQQGDYYMDVREFGNGAVEVLLRPIRPMFEGAIRSMADPLSYANACKELGESPSTYTGPRIEKEQGEQSDYELADNHRRAVKRAVQNIRWLAMQIEADRLLTLSYRRNEENREVVKADFKRFVRMVRKEYPEWQYVAVLEKQDRGAYHLHVAVHGWQRINFLRRCWYKALGGKGDEVGEMTPGQIDVTSPRKAKWGTQLREWRTSKLAQYLTKYLGKTFDETTSEKKRYWHSVDAKQPPKTRYLLGAIEFVAAIKEAWSVLYYSYGFDIDFSRAWVAKSGDCLWMSLGEAA